ncbi:MAG: DUF2442 domain-containing protein [Muribaculaceae bacterium]|nr:DUF2442 domain-containing protein [Muribaculaceae bacterium]
MNRTQVAKVWLDEDAVWIELNDGRIAKEYFADYYGFASSTSSQRQNYRLSHFGIHWPEIDEDLSYAGFFESIKRNL